MRNFHDTFETNKRSFISAFSICMTVPLNRQNHIFFMSNRKLLNEKFLIVMNLQYCYQASLLFLPKE